MQHARKEKGRASPEEAAERKISLSVVGWPRTLMSARPVDNPDFWSYSSTPPRSVTAAPDTPAAPNVAVPIRARRKGFYRGVLLFMDGGPADEKFSQEDRTADR